MTVPATLRSSYLLRFPLFLHDYCQRAASRDSDSSPGEIFKQPRPVMFMNLDVLFPGRTAGDVFHMLNIRCFQSRFSEDGKVDLLQKCSGAYIFVPVGTNLYIGINPTSIGTGIARALRVRFCTFMDLNVPDRTYRIEFSRLLQILKQTRRVAAA